MNTAPAQTPHIIALDIDGTIVGYDDSLSQRVHDAILGAEAAGHHIVIATGRAVGGALHIASRLGLDHGLMVCSNGSVTAEIDPEAEVGYKVHSVVTFDPRPALETMRSVVPGGLFMVEDPDLKRWATGYFPPGELSISEDFQVVDFEELCQKEATRIVMRDLESTNEVFAEAVDEMGLHGVTYSIGWSNWLDISPDGVSKASGLEQVRRELDVPREHTFCAGDGSNDMEMMGWAHRAVAMGQASDALKAVADEVTGPVADDGLASALAPYQG